MARRASSGEANISLDSLMDTLTNVVGILAFIIILMQLSLAEAGNRIEKLNAKFNELTPDATAAIRDDLVNLKRYLSDIQRVYGEISIEKTQEGTVDLSIVKDLKEILYSVSQDPSLLPKKKDVPELEEIKKIQEEITRLQVELERLKELKAKQDDDAPPIKKISLPEPREVPEGMQALNFICRFNNIWPLNNKLIIERFQKEIRTLLGLPANQQSIRIDSSQFKTVFEHFRAKAVGDEYTVIEIENIPNVLSIRLTPKRMPQGEPSNIIMHAGSVFQRTLKEHDPKKHYVRFLVWGDSFRVYLDARRIVEEMGFEVAWTPFSVDDPLQQYIGDTSGESNGNIRTD